MRYELYVDSLFFLNFIMNLYLLLLVDRSTLRTAAFGRLMMGAAVGAGGFLLPFLGTGTAVLRFTAGIALGTAGMLCVTFPVRGLRMFLKLLERLALYSFGMGGALLFVIRWLPGVRSLMASMPGILAMGTVFFLLFRRFKGEIRTENSLCKATLSKDGESVEVMALLDSGNGLTEPISGRPVCVVDREVYDSLWRNGTVGFRAIPYHSIGRKRGILRGYLLPELLVEAEDLRICLKDVYIAVSEEEISGAEGAEAESVNMIINPRLLTEDRKGKPRRRQNERLK